MRFEKTIVLGLENAILGMRLPMCKDIGEAIKKSDTKLVWNEDLDSEEFIIGENDLRICENLINADENGAAGQPNSKFLRMIHVQVAITAPLYWWKEMDTYKVGTVANSTSTMHKLADTPITRECFEMDDYETELRKVNLPLIWQSLLFNLETLRKLYIETKDKRYWKELIRLLPESWLQTRMFDCDYATLRNIYFWRKNHKLAEWRAFCDWVKNLPYAKEFLEG